jgi:hypothetical protein
MRLHLFSLLSLLLFVTSSVIKGDNGGPPPPQAPARTITFIGLDVTGPFFYQSKPGIYTELEVPAFAASAPLAYSGPALFNVFRRVQTETGTRHESIGQFDLSNVSSGLVVISADTHAKLKAEVLDTDWTRFPAGSYRVYNRLGLPSGVMLGKDRVLLMPGAMHQSSAKGARTVKILVMAEIDQKLETILNNVLFFRPGHRRIVFIIESNSKFFYATGSSGLLQAGEKYHLVTVDEVSSDAHHASLAAPRQ